MKKLLLLFVLGFTFTTNAAIYVIQVWDGYYQFLPNSLTINLGDTIEWRKLDDPMMYHTITSTNIPAGAVAFDEDWQMPADTFFQYVPAVAGLYDYECTPHALSHNMIGSFTVNPVAGLTSALDTKPVFVYPNPVKSILNVESVLESDYLIINLHGKVILEGILEEKIDVDQLKSGQYILLVGGNNKSTIRFTKF